MNSKMQQNAILEEALDKIQLPDWAYDRAKDRYDDLGEWLGREDSAFARNSPRIFPQGSFRLGTAIYPLAPESEYDLDLACKLQKGISTLNYTQKQLRDLFRTEIEKYREARKIQTPVRDKRRCVRLEYKSTPGFHLDVVPCIPADEDKQKKILAAINERYAGNAYSQKATENTVFITDNERNDYARYTEDWNISNPEGYALWFEERMRETEAVSENMLVARAEVDKLPANKRKRILQRVVQLLKRHRDQMFTDPKTVDCKPISIIITTLAAKAYKGEASLAAALVNVLNGMADHVHPQTPRIPNPVAPDEDFSDKWSSVEGKRLKLEENFWRWLEQAKVDFMHLLGADTIEVISESVSRRLLVAVDKARLSDKTGIPMAKATQDFPAIHAIAASSVSKPWRRD